MSTMTQEQWREHAAGHTKANSWWLKDVRGIECSRVCDEPGCIEAVKARYNPSVFGDYSDVEEQIEEDY